jgi:hypothetical protein
MGVERVFIYITIPVTTRRIDDMVASDEGADAGEGL